MVPAGNSKKRVRKIMPLLVFMPWCRIDKNYEVGEISILPFERHKPINGLDEAVQCRINTIMASYKTIEGKPVDRAALVRLESKSAIDDLTDPEFDIVQELVALSCFSGLSKCDYFNALGSYCNSDCFSLCFQKFDKADFTALTSRRREGQTQSGWPIDEITISVPVHCHSVKEVSLDSSLIEALVNYRAKVSEWARWQNAISCFNQANTDSDNIRYQVEWVLLCSAFEHILEAKPNAKDVASKFSKILVPSEKLLVKNSTRLSGKQQDEGQLARYAWMREFYKIRGDFAHGKLDTQQPSIWNPLEHVVLATIAFPLVVKCLLNQAGYYKLTENDQAQIDVFEKFADTPEFLSPPKGKKGSLDSNWKRLVDNRRRKITFQAAVKKAFEELEPEEKIAFEEGSDKENQ